MNLYRLRVVWRRRCRSSLVLQTLLILAFWRLGEFVAHAVHLPVPGAILGLAMVLALLGSRRLSICTVRRGARWFIADMLLFFVPAVLAVLDHPELIGVTGLKILTVIVVGTLIVMVVTAAVIDVCYCMNLTGKGQADAAE